jgi:ribonuclease HII
MFGDEASCTDQLGLDQVIAATTPRQALDLGFNDAKALIKSQRAALKQDKINLDDLAVTVQLVQQNAVLGMIGSTSSSGHDGRFPTLVDTVKSYNDGLNLRLTDQE